MSEVLEERIKHERELREAMERSIEKALRLQAEKYDEHLAALNHAHEQLQQDRADFLPRGEYGIHHGALEDRLRAVERLVFIALGAVLLIELLARVMK